MIRATDETLKFIKFGREPWSSGYVRRLMFQRSWVWIPAPDTGWTWHFFTLICCKNCIVCLKRPKINEKEAEVGPRKKNYKIALVIKGNKGGGWVSLLERFMWTYIEGRHLLAVCRHRVVVRWGLESHVDLASLTYRSQSYKDFTA